MSGANDLRSKTTRALGHMGAGGAIGKVVSLGTTLVMARILSPADYGLMAGIGSAIVQKPKLCDAEVNGCFAIAMMANLVFFGAMVASSGQIAHFFVNERLRPIISMLSVAFVLGAVSTVPMFLRKEMHFKAIAGISIIALAGFGSMANMDGSGSIVPMLDQFIVVARGEAYLATDGLSASSSRSNRAGQLAAIFDLTNNEPDRELHGKY